MRDKNNISKHNFQFLYAIYCQNEICITIMNDLKDPEKKIYFVSTVKQLLRVVEQNKNLNKLGINNFRKRPTTVI